MNTTKHTPGMGPWAVSVSKRAFAVLDEFGNRICSLSTRVTHQKEKASLIAAAPELGGCVMDVLGWCVEQTQLHGMVNMPPEMVKALQEAARKAGLLAK